MYDNDFMAREIDNEYLMHYGRKGMKWYQHIFTDAKSAARAVKKAIAKKAAERKEYRKANPKTKKLTSKNVRKMSVDELQNRIDRLKKEQELLNINKQIKEMSAANASMGKRFIKALGSKVIAPAVQNVAKDALEKRLKKWLNSNLDHQNNNSKKPDNNKPENKDEQENDIPEPENREQQTNNKKEENDSNSGNRKPKQHNKKPRKEPKQRKDKQSSKKETNKSDDEVWTGTVNSKKSEHKTKTSNRRQPDFNNPIETDFADHFKPYPYINRYLSPGSQLLLNAPRTKKSRNSRNRNKKKAAHL